MRALVWFRADLRLADNPALWHACRDADQGVEAVFALCPGQWKRHDWGAMKVDFLLRNLAELADSLATLQIPLKIVHTDTFAEVPQSLLNLAKKHNYDALFFNREYEVNEIRRDEAVSRLFDGNGLRVRSFHDQTILDLSRVRSATGGPYTVFTPFRKKWYETFREGGGIACRPVPNALPKARSVRADPVPASVVGFPKTKLPNLWPAGEHCAQTRLSRFVAERLGDYDSGRDYPARDGTSTLSPYLAFGIISPRQCLHAALAANHGRLDSGKNGVVTWISELIWREFYRHIVMNFPQVCMNRAFKANTEKLPWRHDEMQFAAWCEGRTGVPIVDAGMHQLAQTGWMHNRVRMITAMFLTKDLFMDWRWGEAHFMRSLVDGDLANNNGGWQWAASTGTDAAPYFRFFNPYLQSRKFDPEGEYIRRFVPELADLPNDLIHEPHKVSALFKNKMDYPDPMVDHADVRRRVMLAFSRL